jgi:hypothetical protein
VRSAITSEVIDGPRARTAGSHHDTDRHDLEGDER